MNEPRPNPASPAAPAAQRQISYRTQGTDYLYLYSHYSRLLWRWKWFLAFVSIAATACAFAVITKILPKIPKASATVLIGIDAPSREDRISDFSEPTGTKVELIRSRGFLADIVEKLALQLMVDDKWRSEIFDSCHVDSSALPGKYQLTLDPFDRNSFVITVTNKRLGMHNRIVQRGALASSDEIRFSGVYLRLASPFVRAPHTVSFSIVPPRYVIEELLKNLTVIPPDPRADRLHISVTLEGHDYALIARILNVMADEYVNRNLAIRTRRVRTARELLEKQLATAAQQLAVSESALRAFLSAHPQVGLSMQTQQSVTELMSIRTGGFDLDNLIAEATNLQGQYRAAADEITRQQATNEILLFLTSRNNTRAAVLFGDFNRSVQERNALEQSYAPDHPLAMEKRKELKAKLDDIGSQALGTLGEFISRCQQQKNAKEGSAARIMSQLSSLPSLERQLAELQSRQQIDAQLHSSILSRLNETKIADAAEVADVFVMDYAVPPLLQSPLLILAKYLGMALVAGLALAFGPVLAYDYFDPTARSEQEAQRKTSLPVVAGIPAFDAKTKRKQKKKGKKPGAGGALREDALRAVAALPTISNEPNYVGEQFRSLRTKVLLALHNDERHGIIITSLNPNEGKSTVAANLAVTMAQNGFRTILIDGDMRRGSLHEQLGCRQTPGLSECLAERQPLTAETVREIIQRCAVEKLGFIASGAHIAHPLEMFASEKAKSLAAALNKVYDIIIVDTPPLAVASDAVAVQESFGRYLLIARAGKTNLAELQRKVAEFPSVRNTLIGVVLNEADMDSSRQEKYYHYYAKRKSG